MSSNSPLPKYVSRFTDNRGKTRIRFRRRGYSKYLPSLHSPNFQDEYEDALEASRLRKPKEPKAAKYSLEWTSLNLRQETAWKELSKRTRMTKTRLHERMCEPWGDTDMTTLDVGGIMDRLDMISKPTVRNRIRGIFNEMFEYLVARRIVHANPVLQIKRLKHKSKSTPPWTVEECRKFERYWPRGTKQRLAYELFRSTIQASVDIANMSRSMVKGNFIEGRRVKTDEPYRVNITASLAEELTLHEIKFMFLETEYGKSFSEDGFNDWFNAAVAKAGIASRSHGLRVLGCIEYAEAGCTAKELMACSGHKTLAEAQRYVQMANAKKLADSAAGKRELSSRVSLDKMSKLND